MKSILVFVVILLLTSITLMSNSIENEGIYKVSLDTIVGDSIDSLENNKYDLFGNREIFLEATIYYNRFKAIIEVSMKIKDKDNQKIDSIFKITFRELVILVEKIQFYEDIKNGDYKFGSKKPSIISDNFALNKIFVDFDVLKFSNKSDEYKIKKLSTIKLVLSTSFINGYYNEVKSLSILNSISNSSYTSGASLHLPIKDYPEIFLRIGYNDDIVKNFIHFKSAVYFKIFENEFIITPIIGVGFGYSELYSDHSPFILEIRKKYGFICLGFNLIKNWIDLIGFIPLKSSLSTNFRDKNYKINIIGVEIGMFVIL